ncbi:uncharacterized protein LOC122965585 [Scomber scombrus]|uniref:Uncharacterized protein LOC122965585 n=1 Tax=Scomber scombrus TaxID=13677 RepID=A0AAV1NTF7_SCOSC
MAGTVHIVMRLLLLSLITTGVHGRNRLKEFPEKNYDIIYPCEDKVCFRLWQFKTKDYIAIVSNGEIQTNKHEKYGDSKCTLKITNLTAEDIRFHRCQEKPDFFSPYKFSSVAQFNLMHGKTLSLHCVFLTYVDKGHCHTRQRKRVFLTWVNEDGAKIQEDSKHEIKQRTTCDTTLTIIPQSPENKKFRCQVTLDKEVNTSVAIHVRIPAPKGRGRGMIIDSKPQGGNKEASGMVVGVVGCLVLTVVVALFIRNRRRTNTQLPDESSNTTSTNNVMNTDDVIYSDIIFPVGSDSVRVHECGSTEYACIRYK